MAKKVIKEEIPSEAEVLFDGLAEKVETCIILVDDGETAMVGIKGSLIDLSLLTAHAIRKQPKLKEVFQVGILAESSKALNSNE